MSNLSIIADNQEHTINFHGLDIKYIMKDARLDTHNMIVIFSGYGAKSNFTYDFRGNSLASIRSYILWIKDEFFGNCTLYIGMLNNINIENSIYNFIIETAKKLYIEKENIIILGASKGGSVALYYGLKYNFRYILSSAPQIELGKFLSKHHKDVFYHIIQTNELDDLIINKFDNMIYDLLKVTDTEKYIYIFSADCDEHENCSNISSKLLEKIKYFYHIKIDSRAIWKHNMITSYCVPAIQAVISLIDFGLQPTFDNKINMVLRNNDNDQKYLDLQKSCHQLITDLNTLHIKKNLCFIEGVCFIQGYTSSSYGIFRKKLYITNKFYEYIFDIGSTYNKDLSRQYFYNAFCNYSTGGFADLNHQGFDISLIKYGTYDIYVSVESDNIFCKNNLHYSRSPIILYGTSSFYIIFHENNQAKLKHLEAISQYTPHLCTVEKKWKHDAIYHWEGKFIVYGLDILKYGQCKWYLVFQAQQTYIIEIGMTHRDYLKNELNDYGFYQKAYYSTMHGKGVDTSQFAHGQYNVYVTLIYNIYIWSYKIDAIVV